MTRQPGDAVYLSLTVYGGPDDGRYTERIVGTVNDHSPGIRRSDGNFELWLSPDPQPGAWLKLEPDAVFALTRDYLTDRNTDAAPHWTSRSSTRPQRRARGPADLTRRLRAARTWLHDQLSFLPTKRGAHRTRSHEPYPVPTQTFGWAAGDAAYAMGAYELEPDQALVIEGTSPECVFWNLCLWNPFLHTYDFTTTSGSPSTAPQVDYEPDGSWRIVDQRAGPRPPQLGVDRGPSARA